MGLTYGGIFAQVNTLRQKKANKYNNLHLSASCMVSYEILNSWWCFCHFVCLGSAELLNPTQLLANGVCCCLVLGRGMQFKAFVPQRLASVNLSGGLSSSSIFESLDKSLHTVVPFVSILSTVEGAVKETKKNYCQPLVYIPDFVFLLNQYPNALNSRSNKQNEGCSVLLSFLQDF